MVNLKALLCIKDIHIVEHVMFDCGCQNASGASVRFEVMMRPLVENGVADVLFAMYVLFCFLLAVRIGIQAGLDFRDRQRCRVGRPRALRDMLISKSDNR